MHNIMCEKVFILGKDKRIKYESKDGGDKTNG